MQALQALLDKLLIERFLQRPGNLQRRAPDSSPQSTTDLGLHRRAWFAGAKMAGNLERQYIFIRQRLL